MAKIPMNFSVTPRDYMVIENLAEIYRLFT